jgi:hypothetical protein
MNLTGCPRGAPNCGVFRALTLCPRLKPDTMMYTTNRIGARVRTHKGMGRMEGEMGSEKVDLTSVCHIVLIK